MYADFAVQVSDLCYGSTDMADNSGELLSGHGVSTQLTNSTWEGDNTILSLQAGRALIGAWGGELQSPWCPGKLTRSRHQEAPARTRSSIPGPPWRPSAQVRRVALAQGHPDRLVLRRRERDQEGQRGVPDAPEIGQGEGCRHGEDLAEPIYRSQAAYFRLHLQHDPRGAR